MKFEKRLQEQKERFIYWKEQENIQHFKNIKRIVLEKRRHIRDINKHDNELTPTINGIFLENYLSSHKIEVLKTVGVETKSPYTLQEIIKLLSQLSLRLYRTDQVLSETLDTLAQEQNERHQVEIEEKAIKTRLEDDIFKLTEQLASTAADLQMIQSSPNEKAASNVNENIGIEHSPEENTTEKELALEDLESLNIESGLDKETEDILFLPKKQDLLSSKHSQYDISDSSSSEDSSSSKTSSDNEAQKRMLISPRKLESRVKSCIEDQIRERINFLKSSKSSKKYK